MPKVNRVQRWRARKRAKAHEPIPILPGAVARVTRNEVWAKLHTDDPGVRDLVSRAISYWPEGYQFSPKYKAGVWDGRIRLLRKSGVFPGGLSERVTAALSKEGVDVSFADRSDLPWTEPQLAEGRNLTELRPYQLEALQRAQDARRGVFEAATGTGKCLAPDTRVLTEDLRWVPVGSLAVGDVLVGFDEISGRYQPRRFQRSHVQSTGRSLLPCYEIELETGERLLATGEHQWLIRRDKSNNVDWATTEKLYWSHHHKVRRGPIRLPRYIDVWTTDESNAAGYLRGLLDGEGSIRRRKEYGGSFNGVAFHQKDEAVLKDARETMSHLGYAFKERSVTNDVHELAVGTRDGIRVLGHIRPRRLLEKWLDLKWPRLSNRGYVAVVNVRPVGIREVVTLQTSTKTFIAEGFGSHNTEIMAELIRRLGGRALILVAQSDLAWQTIERFSKKDTGLVFPHARSRLYGIVGDDVDEPALITVALYQTLHQRVTPVCLVCGTQGEREWRTCQRITGLGKRCGGELDTAEMQATEEWLATFDSIHLDEAHRAPAKTWWPIVQACPAYWRFGYSATPFKSARETELKLVGATGEVCYSFPARQAIDEGYLTPPHVIFIKTSFPKFEEYGFQQAYKDGIVAHEKRNKLIADIADKLVNGWDVPTLILMRWHEQGYALRNLLRRRGVEAEYVSGRADTDERKAALRGLESGKIKCIIGTTIFDEGINAPRIGALILAGGGKARHKQIQRIGRGLRLMEGKEYLAVFDFIDDHSFRIRHDDEDAGILAVHSHERLLAVKQAKFDYEVLTTAEVMSRLEAGDIRKGVA